MQIKLRRLDDAFHFLASNEAGNEVHLDTGPEEGGSGQGAGPMQAVIMALGGCSGIDIVLILKKGRQRIDSFDIEISYERAAGPPPALFSQIRVHYILHGSLQPEKVRRAVDLSINKYCSVARILEKTASIAASYSVNGTRYELDAAPQATHP